MRAAVVTVSDRTSRGEREDRSGPRLIELLHDDGWEVGAPTVVPDELLAIVRTLIECVDRDGVNLVLTTGGTGAAPRDVTPEATRLVIERPLAGMAEALRRQSEQFSRYAVLSRGEAGSRGKTLIVNLPGNPKAVDECWPVLRPLLGHACRLLQGIDDPHNA